MQSFAPPKRLMWSGWGWEWEPSIHPDYLAGPLFTPEVSFFYLPFGPNVILPIKIKVGCWGRRRKWWRGRPADSSSPGCLTALPTWVKCAHCLKGMGERTPARSCTGSAAPLHEVGRQGRKVVSEKPLQQDPPDCMSAVARRGVPRQRLPGEHPAPCRAVQGLPV